MKLFLSLHLTLHLKQNSLLKIKTVVLLLLLFCFLALVFFPKAVDLIKFLMVPSKMTRPMNICVFLEKLYWLFPLWALLSHFWSLYHSFHLISLVWETCLQTKRLKENWWKRISSANYLSVIFLPLPFIFIVLAAWIFKY